MQLVATFWWLWAVILVVATGYTFYNQIKRMKRLKETGMDGFTQGLGSLATAAVIGFGAGILLIVSLIYYVVEHVK